MKEETGDDELSDGGVARVEGSEGKETDCAEEDGGDHHYEAEFGFVDAVVAVGHEFDYPVTGYTGYDA